MFIIDLLGWWYSHGWSWSGTYLFITRSQQIIRFFSIPDLLKTLFTPYRQDFVNVQGASIGLKLQAFGGNIISRIFGFILRTALIIAGCLLLFLNLIFALLCFAVWPLLPLSPVLAVVLFALGAGHV